MSQEETEPETIEPALSHPRAASLQFGLKSGGQEPLPERQALAHAKKTGRQVPIRDHPEGHHAYPDGETVGPYQQE